MSFQVVVGLGNPGEKYAGTRHNLGFEVLNLLAREHKLSDLTETGFYRSGKIRVEQNKLRLVWPLTYMNLSGQAVAELLEDKQISPDQMLVVVDDFNLPLGALRVRLKGTDGGHNGLASIIETLGHNDFPRLRLGIGPIPEGISSVDFVLDRFSEEERKTAESMVARAAEAVIFGTCHKIDELSSRYNYNPALSENE